MREQPPRLGEEPSNFNLFPGKNQLQYNRPAGAQPGFRGEPPHYMAHQEITSDAAKPDHAGPRPSLENDALFAIRHGAPLSRGRLWSDVRNLAERLPDRAYLLNLCEDRYLFCITLLAALCRGQVCLLPPSGQAGVLHGILHDFPDCYLASDREQNQPPCPWFPVSPPAMAGAAAAMDFDAGQTAVIAFTSGSTGRPKACPHTFGTFRTSARMAVRGLGLETARLLLVSTTPPQHMYGLETSIFWPLFSPLVLHAGRPFFPEDIRRTVRGAPLPCLLASTPTHLWSLVRTEGAWENLRGVICSTANLSETLARQVENATGAVLHEIYGSTETLSFATRQTAREPLWRLYPEASLSRDGEGSIGLAAPHLKEPARLEDLLRIGPDGRFAVLGRAGDMVKIGGKRGSLADLNRRLAEIDGIVDGLFLTLEDERGECRLAAVVVSALSKRDILAALRPSLDEVFLPKRIHFVAKIPRNEVGKVVKAELERLLAGLRS
jgi:acyl-coenzyme A synthetase/AMP-(fatty) acid ligase